MKLALKIDVNTWRGTLQGVPRLVEILRRQKADASFLFSLGPDHTGRAVRRAFHPGFMKQLRRTSALSRYGIKSLMYGTLLPGPDIGRRGADIMRATRDAGFEAAIHCWDRVKWQDGVASANSTWTETEMRRAHQRYIEIFGDAAPGHGAAGWKMNPHALRLTQRMGYRWASDCRGTHPFVPVWNGEIVTCPQLPTTLPTLDELIGTDDITTDNVHLHLLRVTAQTVPGATNCDHVFTLQAELEGLKLGDTLERLLTGWREQGYQLVSLGTMRDALDPALLPRHEMVRGEIPGHAGCLMLQGEEFLSNLEGSCMTEIFTANPAPPSAIGLRVPEFSVPATGGEFTLSAFQGKPLVLYFYPKDNTPGCTTQAQQFRDLHGEFVKAGCTVVGISRDSLKSHESFKARLGLPFELISDIEGVLCRMFDVVKNKMLYGKKVLGIERSTFLIDANGILRQEWRSTRADGNAAAVLEAVRKL